MAVKGDKILFSYKKCQRLKITNISGTVSASVITFTVKTYQTLTMGLEVVLQLSGKF
jgi:hypothetical protein